MGKGTRRTVPEPKKEEAGAPAVAEPDVQRLALTLEQLGVDFAVRIARALLTGGYRPTSFGVREVALWVADQPVERLRDHFGLSRTAIGQLHDSIARRGLEFAKGSLLPRRPLR